jgi:GNAT superfamily N-acetyltransferase
MPVADLARVLLDEPRWVEARFMLLRGEATVTGLTGDRRHFVARSTRWPLAVVVGRPDHPFIAGVAADAADDLEILAAVEHADHVAAALVAWERVGATIHAWPHERPLPGPPPGSEARLLGAHERAALRHMPEALREELEIGAAYGPVAAAFADGLAVSVCYATAITETLWDVSVDTLEAYRGRGLAGKAVACAAAALAPAHKWPVWGAADDNPASAAAARKAGFVPADRLVIFRRPLAP